MLANRFILNSKIAKNAGWLIAGKIVQLIISFFVGILSARYLGPSNYGLLNYGAAYTGFFTSLCTLGINSVIVKELVSYRDLEEQVLGTAIVLKLIASFISVIIIILIVSIVDRNESETILVVILCSIGLIFNVFETFNYWFQARLESKITAIVTLCAYSITSAYKIYLIITKRSVGLFAVATSLDFFCVGLILAVVYKKRKGKNLTFSWEYGKELLSKSWHFILPSIMVAIYAQTDKMMLKQLISETELGYYSTAATVCVTWCFVLQAIIDSMSPPIMEDYKQGNIEAYNKKNRMMYSVVFYLSITVSLTLFLLARPIICILYGESYLPAVAPLRAITWYTAFSYLGVARETWIVCENKQKYLVWIYFTGAVSNVVLNKVLIPMWGATGAAVASLVAQVVTSMIAPCFIKPLRKNVKLMLDGVFLKG